MFNSLSDFSNTHYDSPNDITTHYTPLSDRTISIGLAEGLYVISSNNPLFDPYSPSVIHTWDDTVTDSTCADNLQTALEIANNYATNPNISWDPDLHTYDRLHS